VDDVTTSEGARSGFSHFFLNLLRVMTGLLFMQHGAQKMFGLFGFPAPVQFPSLIWVAGVLELFGGALIAVGLFTRPLAFLLAGEMAYAYFTSHFPNGPFPIANRGEPAVFFLVIYLFLAANGGGAFSLDGLFAARRRRSAAA
jgi:putative oxidoreductase